MAEPSYYPLRPLRYPVEGTTPEQPFKEDSDLSYPADTIGSADPPGFRSSMFLAPLRPQLFRRNQFEGHRLHSWRRIRTPLEMALLPLVAIGYLAFCYTVHGKVVPVNTYGLYAITTQHLATIKGGITSISIIIVSIALYPIYVVVSSLKSEEFFRILSSRSHGVPLETIDHISTPSFGHIDQMMAVWRHACSNYYILGIFVSLLTWIVSTLAPGTLTVESVLSDGELMAFAIGAVTTQSVLNGSYPPEPAFNASLNSVPAASIMWAEIELGVQYSFRMANTSEPDYVAYIAPKPIDLPITTSARWLSDVIGMNPMCSWASTNLTTPVQVTDNSSEFEQYFATAYLLDFDLDVKITATDTSELDGGTFATVKNPLYYVTNHTTQAPASDGSTVFLLGQCHSGSGCTSSFGIDLTLDLSGINSTFTISLTNQTWTMAILACIPNIMVETREVRNDGQGLFSVQPLPSGSQLTRQGNLNSIQTTALFSIVTMSLSQGIGQPSASQGSYFQLGSQVQGELLFGKAQYDNLPGISAQFGTLATISPAPIENITQGYLRIIQSGAKSYLMGYLGTAYVPGRISASEIVFAASIPNLVVSSVVFALLIVLIIFAHFRPNKGMEFTLVNIAAAVHGSELPAQFAQMKEQVTGAYTDMDTEGDVEMDSAGGKGKVRRADGASADHRDIVEMLGERRIFMQRRADGSPVLHIS